MATTPTFSPISVDALVIGAGPVGLFAAFQFGLLGMRCAVVDALPFPGGQTTQLYPDKPIYDIPGIPAISGRQLTEQLVAQIAPLGVTLHLGLQISSLTAVNAEGNCDSSPPPSPDAGTSHPAYALQTTQSHRPSQSGPSFSARFVCICAGVGAFTPRPLPGISTDAFSELDDAQLHWHFSGERLELKGRHTIVGGGPEAVDAALQLSNEASAAIPVTMIHRRDVLQAEPHALEEVAKRRAEGRIQVIAGQVSGFESQETHLTAVRIATPDGSSITQATDHLWILQGLSPRLGPIADWGVTLARRQVAIDTATSATSLPGVFAAGDVVSYPGKHRLIVCGFHEATQAAYAASDMLRGSETPVLYTTTSPLLQQRLGQKPHPIE